MKIIILILLSLCLSVFTLRSSLKRAGCQSFCITGGPAGCTSPFSYIVSGVKEGDKLICTGTAVSGKTCNNWTHATAKYGKGNSCA